MTHRRRERPLAATVWAFVDQVLIVCPACRSQAIVLARGPAGRPRRACGTCGAARDWPWPRATGSCHGYAPADVPDGSVLLGAAVDPWFHAPLWLRTPCAGETLWAYNGGHVAFLRDLVGAGLRIRAAHDGGARNGLLESRLPKWLLAAKHRDEVLRGLDRLAQRVGERR